MLKTITQNGALYQLLKRGPRPRRRAIIFLILAAFLDRLLRRRHHGPGRQITLTDRRSNPE